MIRERRISDQIIYGHVYLSDLAEGREPVPGDRKRLQTLANALGCQPFYLTRIVTEWRAYQAAAPIEEPATPVKTAKSELTQTRSLSLSKSSVPIGGVRECEKCLSGSPSWS
jgi:hypothetical protein